MTRVLAALAVSLALPGCYLAHRGAPIPDAGAPDAGARDAALPDAGRRDAGARDAGASCAFELRDRASLTWLADAEEGCSVFGAPRAVAHGRGVVLVASEQRICRDRIPFVVAAPATVRDGRLAIPPAVVSLPHDGTAAPVAATDGAIGIATGLSLITLTEDLAMRSMPVALAEPPVSMPGCPMSLRAEHLAGAGGRWLATFDLFECDVSGAIVSTYALDGSDPREIARTWEPLAGAVALDRDRFAWVSRPRGDVPRSWLWRSAGDALARETFVEVEGAAAAIVEGREPGHVTLLFARTDPASVVRLTVIELDAEDRERARYEIEPFAMPAGGFEVLGLAADRTPFGVVVAVTLAWTGGAIPGGLAVVALDDEGAVLGRFEHFDEAGTGGTAGVAAQGEDVIVHHDVTDHRTTEALLFGCR